MGKEETIGLIRPGHTSPAEIKQKLLPRRALLWLTLGLPVPSMEGFPSIPGVWCLVVHFGVSQCWGLDPSHSFSLKSWDFGARG